jgi:prepilin-type processing-associated H-X9-DG protein
VAFFSYSSDYDDWTCPQRNDFEGGSDATKNWEWKLAPYVGYTKTIDGTFFPEVPIFICPGDNGEQQVGCTGSEVCIPTNYGYNRNLGCFGTATSWMWNPQTRSGAIAKSGKKVNRFKDPSKVLVMTDILTNTSVVTGYGAAPSSNMPQFESTYASWSLSSNKIDMWRHGNLRANIMFVDGHVGSDDPRHMDREQAMLTTDTYYAY